MRIAVALGGTDRGISGIGVYVREVLPRLAERARAHGESIVAIGTRADLDAYPLDGIDKEEAPAAASSPAMSALWHLALGGRAARRAGADVLLLPAANRRMAIGGEVPTVAVVHDLAQMRVASKYDRLRMVYVNGALTRALRRATELVAVSRATRDDMVSALGVSADRIHVIPNGVDVSRFSPAQSDDKRVAEALLSTGLRAPYLLYAARLEHPGKNHLRLLRAFATSRARSTHTLAFAGKDWGAEAMLRGEAQALGIASRVRFLGFVPDAVVPGLVAGADAVAMVGLCEGFGLPALEALAAGRPVVAARAGALPEVTGDLAASCDPLDERSIQEAIEQALLDEELRRRARYEGPAWAARFSWDSTAEGLFRVSLRCAARTSAGDELLPGELLPRASAIDVIRGRALLVGSRLRQEAPRGLVSPVESRIHMGIPYGDLADEEAKLLRERSPRRDAGVVLRALIAAALAPGKAATPARSPTIVSARVDNVTIEEALDRIFEAPGDQANAPPEEGNAPAARHVYIVHPHALNLAAFDAELAAILASGDLVLPDGIGIRVAASLLGVAMRHNVNGTDLLPLLCQRAAAEGVPLALVGAAPGIAEACAERLVEAAPGLSIGFVSHGFLDESASLEVAGRIRDLGRSVVLVGMGSPLQERWAKRYLADTPGATVLTVGGLFDFYSGRMPRAPVALREIGLEWAFRLAQEPRRMAKRYLVGNPLFLALALRQRLTSGVYIDA